MSAFNPIPSQELNEDEPAGAVRVHVSSSGEDDEFLRLVDEEGSVIFLSPTEANNLAYIIRHWLERAPREVVIVNAQ